MPTTVNRVADEDNYLEILSTMNSLNALAFARDIIFRLEELNIDGDNGYWLEKPHKFPEYWIPALNGTLDETDFEVES
jgi:hypothetical protein